MSNKNALKGGTDWSDGDILYAADLNDTFNSFFMKAYADNTGGASAGAETDIATTTILAADFDANSTSVTFMINAALEMTQGTSSATATFRLKVNGSTVKTVIYEESSTATDLEFGGAITYLAAANDLSASDIIVKVTGETTNSAGAVCNGLTVLAIRNN